MNMSDDGRVVVRLAPDWQPNTNHIGFYVARALGYYAEVGLDLAILPFDGEAMPDRALTGGTADVGLMPQQSVLTMRARGADVVSLAVLQRPNTTTLMVRADSGITHPAQFAGKRYASYGTAFEVAVVENLIAADGGSGRPELVPAEKLAILQALWDGELDLAWGFYAWEGLQAELSGHSLRHFFLTEHGMPNEYFPLLVATRDWVARDAETLGAFVCATLRGYTYAAAHPGEAADHFLAQVDPALLPDHAPELVRRSLLWLAPRLNGTLASLPSADPWGWHDRATWAAYAAYVRRLATERHLPSPAADAEEQGYTNHFLVPAAFP